MGMNFTATQHIRIVLNFSQDQVRYLNWNSCGCVMKIWMLMTMSCQNDWNYWRQNNNLEHQTMWIVIAFLTWSTEATTSLFSKICFKFPNGFNRFLSDLIVWHVLTDIILWFIHISMADKRNGIHMQLQIRPGRATIEQDCAIAQGPRIWGLKIHQTCTNGSFFACPIPYIGWLKKRPSPLPF